MLKYSFSDDFFPQVLAGLPTLYVISSCLSNIKSKTDIQQKNMIEDAQKNVVIFFAI